MMSSLNTYIFISNLSFIQLLSLLILFNLCLGLFQGIKLETCIPMPLREYDVYPLCILCLNYYYVYANAKQIYLSIVTGVQIMTIYSSSECIYPAIDCTIIDNLPFDNETISMLRFCGHILP